ncbi:MAG: hypothetical protein KF901_14960 [Myxococcales bacterium]|nr:hypothetical protein [Myxococcales bacterium]
MTSRQRRAAELIANGLGYGEVGYQLGIDVSTVASHISEALRSLGLERVDLPWLVHGPLDVWPQGDGTLLASPPGIDEHLLAELTPSERDVVKLLVAGCSNRDIASARCRAERTIANQLASVYRTLRVGSRFELAALVARRVRERELTDAA